MTKIYLLIYPELKAFKLGKADNVFSRACSLKKWWGEPDYLSSSSLDLDAGLVFKFEKGLHLLLDQFSMNFEEGDGKTEFFSLDAYNDAVEYINIYIKSNKLSSQLVKGIDKPTVSLASNVSRKRDFYFYKHNASKRRTIDTYRESLRKMETVLRVNNLLTKYRTKIKFSLTKQNQTYTLILYERQCLAHILFKNLSCMHAHFSGTIVGDNFSESLKFLEDSIKLEFHFHNTLEDQFISAIAMELEDSFRLLQKAVLRSGA